jgi:hypothetical protein
MAKLKSEDLDLELEFEFLSYEDYSPVEYTFKCTLCWNGIPVLNERTMKRGTSYWDKGKEGGIVGSEMVGFTLIKDMEDALKTKSVRIWEAWPDPDMCVSIYPGRFFPYLDEEDSEYNTIIISPDTYQFKGNDCYSGYEGVSFVMTPSTQELKEFINDLKMELEDIKGKK